MEGSRGLRRLTGQKAEPPWGVKLTLLGSGQLACATGSPVDADLVTEGWRESGSRRSGEREGEGEKEGERREGEGERRRREREEEGETRVISGCEHPPIKDNIMIILF